MSSHRGLGYRQAALLAVLERAPGDVPTGYLTRRTGIEAKTCHMALLGLQRRGLVSHVRWGRWQAA